MKTLRVVSLFVVIGLAVLLGCATKSDNTGSAANVMDTTPTPSGNVARCPGILYPANAMDPCTPLEETWDYVNIQSTTEGYILVAMINTAKEGKYTNWLGVFVPDEPMPRAYIYVVNTELCVLCWDSGKEMYVWETDIQEEEYIHICELVAAMFGTRAPKIRAWSSGC